MTRIVLIALAARTAAAAAVVPLPSKARIEASAPLVAYVPTRMAFGFRLNGWQLRQGALHIRFRDAAGRQVTFVGAPTIRLVAVTGLPPPTFADVGLVVASARVAPPGSSRAAFPERREGWRRASDRAGW